MKTFGAATVLHVTDLERSLGFYLETLGFTEVFRYGAEYAGVEHGEVKIHLSTNNVRTPPGAGQIYIFVDAVDAYHAEIIQRGGVPLAEPADWPYGMRDFDIADPDGNLLAFGAEIVEATA